MGRFVCTGQVAVSGMPKSCADLWRIGHSLSGLYSVMGTKRVESVYCDFTKLSTNSGIGTWLNNYVFCSYQVTHIQITQIQPYIIFIIIAGFQTWIGQVDVKSFPVYFYVMRRTSFGTENVPIPFEVTRMNVGTAMNVTSGIFTAPKPGTYFFSFSGIGSPNSYITPQLYLNENLIGSGWTESTTTVEPTFTLQSTLQLNGGDQISLKLNSEGNGSLYDDGDHHTHFTGWLLQEDLNY